MTCSPVGTQAHFYRTAAGAEIDLVLNLPGGKLWAIEVKRSLSPKVERGFHVACDDLRPQRRLVIYPGQESFPMGNDIEATPLPTLCKELAVMAAPR